MTTLTEIRKAVSTALRQAYHKANIYGVDTLEGYKKPSFFVYVTQTFSEATANAVHKNVEIEIDYIQKVPNEIEALEFFDRMESLFCHKLKTENRQLTTDNLNSYFDGENMNIPCFSFEVEFWSAIDKKDNSALMGELHLKQEVN